MEEELREKEGCLEMLKSLGRDEILEILGQGLCTHCDSLLQTRIQSISNRKSEQIVNSDNSSLSDSAHSSVKATTDKSLYSSVAKSVQRTKSSQDSSFSTRQSKPYSYSSPMSVSSKYAEAKVSRNGGLTRSSSGILDELSTDEEQVRLAQVRRKKDFVYMERVNGKSVNVVQGLELHTGIFNSEEQRDIVNCVLDFQRMGQNGQLKERTYSEPRKWMRGKGRATIQFGCCYNYATDKHGNPPGIIRDEEVDPLPQLFKQMIKRMLRWHVLPPTCVPDSCIVNIYDKDDCIPPHIDHHDFVRPFCTVSFLSECNILFGTNLEVVSAGEFAGPVSIPLPVGSVLILNGNGADVAKHCVPGVPSKRISITFRKMDKNKVPYTHYEDPDLTGIKPLGYSPKTKVSINTQQSVRDEIRSRHEVRENASNKADFLQQDEFPPLGRVSLGSQQRKKERIILS